MVRRSLLGLVAWAVALSLSSAASAQTLQFNEILVNPPGTDGGFEYFELFSDTPSLSFPTFVGGGNQLWIVVIEGDGTNQGIIDFARRIDNLAVNSTGTNGLYLLRDSNAAAFVPPASASTNIQDGPDFSPDIENGANTFLLVTNFTSSVGTNLDPDDNGILDSTPWTTVVDAVGLLDNGTGVSYANQLGGVTLAPPTYAPDTVFRDQNSRLWNAADLLGTLPGPLTFDPLETTDLNNNVVTFDNNAWTPGNLNPILVAVPEPTTLVLLGLVAGGFSVRQWSKRRRTKVSE